MDLRPAALAGRWYPRDPEDCRAMLAPPATAGVSDPVAAVAPHAGWVYSGRVASATLGALAAARRDAELIIVFGGHLGRRDAPRLLLEGAWDTPFGPAPIAGPLAETLAMNLPCELESAGRFVEDNAIEVLMPMVKQLWPDAELLTLGVPPTREASGIGKLAIELARGRGHERIAVVGSTDLTHYGPNYDYQPKGRGPAGHAFVKDENDPLALAAMEAMDGEKVLWTSERQRNTCCPGAVMATIAAARALGAKRGSTTEHTTSYEVRPEGPPTSFVGYAGVLFGGARS